MPKLMQGKGGLRDFEPTGEINVTPFIDVMLVLLLVFMIAAPISTTNVPVDLPSSRAQAAPPVDKPITVSIRRDLSLFVGDTPSNPASLAGTLRQQGAKPATTIFLRVDRTVDYGNLIRILDMLRTANFTKISLVGLGDKG